MFDFRKVEQETLSFWKENKIFEKSLESRKKAKKFVFWEGPPTANGLPHIGHFLTRVYKDVYGRYKTMRGFFVLRKAGWDTHGLPVEIEVEKELGFKSKKDIEKFGIAEFNKKAKENVWKYKTEWEEMTRRTGFWLDTDNPYITYENKYIESLWAIIKKIWDKKLLYLAHRVVPFCTRCGTPLSSHEVAQGYRRITDKSVFVKFKVKSLKFKSPELKNLETDNLQTYILAWTTTPWTLPGNVALAVGKDIDYVAVEKDGECFILAKDLVEKVFGSTALLRYCATALKGSDLVGLEYEPLFDVEEFKSDKSYRIYDADFVSTAEGTGVVHTAVMYGEDDYDLGTKVGLPKFHTVDEQGKFVGVGHGLDGLYVKDKVTEDKIIEYLTSNNQLLTSNFYEHDYPFCWRCDTPLIYYAKESWFIKMSSVNKQLLENNKKINWFPKHIKEGRFGQWLKEGKDWAFSRERYWGTPLPIWVCPNGNFQFPISNFQTNPKSKIPNSKHENGCGNYFVAGSLEDLDKYRYKPKNEFYILRHGHSEKNGQGGKEIISSIIANDKYHLTEEGKEQVRNAAKKLKKLGDVDVIIASPFIRTQETAKIVAEELGLKVETEPLLGEFQHGVLCEGMTHVFCIANHTANQGWETKTADGESWKDVRRRMSGVLRGLDKKYNGKKILIVGHGDPLWLLETFTLGLNPKETINSRSEIFPSQGELRKIDLKNWPYDDDGELDLHRPYIDYIELKCKKCGGKMNKIPDLIDVWFDSGAMPYAQWHWPFKETRDKRQETSNLRIFKEQFPADLIVEAVDQTRGWFYTLLAVSTLLDKGAPYKNVMVLGFTLDEKGRKMSKSLKNYVPVMELLDKYGADVLRWYFLSSMTLGEDKSVISKDIEDKAKGFMTTLDNCVRFYELYATDKATWTHDTKPKELLDKWILSKLHGLVGEVTEGLDGYNPTTAARAIEKFVVEDFSNWWLRRSRKRKEALGLLRFILLHLSKVLAPFIPFMAENIKTRLHKFQKAGHESVHLNDWSKVDKKLIDKELEEEMDKVREVVKAGLALRKEKQIKVRQPLAKLVLGRNQQPTTNNPQLLDLIKEELNVKEVVYDEGQKEEISLDLELSTALIYEGYARELMRQIQDMRKEAKYRLDDRVFAQWYSDDEGLSEAIRQFSDEIKKEVLLSEFNNSPHDGKAYDIEKETELILGKKIWIGVRK
ncbi:MAG: class I tRNA ligase family protein [Candidatus Yanofskybacteria bacterium]|nr:class I tRNA ligase family protein [Candidatus Yanofskybacteria bacterium]